MYDLIEEAAVNKIVVKSDFITILAKIITDMSISANAVRIYAYMAYRVGCWQFTNTEIKTTLGIKSDKSIGEYMKELIAGGYIQRQEVRQDGKFGGYQYFLTVCQKMTIGKNKTVNKNLLKNQQNNRYIKNNNRLFKEEKEKSSKKEKEEYLFNNNNNNNNIKEKINKKESFVFQAKNEVDLQFVRFLEYRKEIKKPYKSPKSVDMMYKKFLKICNGSVETAKQIVDNTITNGWQGLFEIKQFGNKRFVVDNNSSVYENIGIKA